MTDSVSNNAGSDAARASAEHWGDAPLTAADFNLYAPQALKIADVTGDGAATRNEIEHTLRLGTDPKMHQVLQFMDDHFEFLNNMGDQYATNNLDAIRQNGLNKVSDLLAGKSTLSWDYLGKTPIQRDMPILGVINGAFLGTVGGVMMESGTIGGAAIVGIAGGAAIGAAVAGYFGVEYYQKYQLKHKIGSQYQTFLKDLEGTENLRANVLSAGK
jgi:hypothetical protein